LEEPTEDIVVVEEVTPLLELVGGKWALQLEEEVVQLLKELSTRCRWNDACDAVDNL
jgi:hypothetical protein